MNRGCYQIKLSHLKLTVWITYIYMTTQTIMFAVLWLLKPEVVTIHITTLQQLARGTVACVQLYVAVSAKVELTTAEKKQSSGISVLSPSNTVYTCPRWVLMVVAILSLAVAAPKRFFSSSLIPHVLIFFTSKLQLVYSPRTITDPEVFL